MEAIYKSYTQHMCDARLAYSEANRLMLELELDAGKEKFKVMAQHQKDAIEAIRQMGNLIWKLEDVVTQPLF